MRYAEAACVSARLEVMPTLQEHSQEPSDEVADLLKEYDIALMVTSKSMTRSARVNDARQLPYKTLVVSMPMLTEKAIERAFDVDYDVLKNMKARIYDFISNKTLTVTNHMRTDMTFEVGKLEYDITTAVDSNLPAGESDFTPKEADGVYVCDRLFAGVDRLESPLTFRVNNKIIRLGDITGDQAPEVISRLEKLGVDSLTVVEGSMGNNYLAQDDESILEGEKKLGTWHIGMNPKDLNVHWDASMSKATVKVNGEYIMREGIFVPKMQKYLGITHLYGN